MDEVDDADLVVERVAALDLGKAGLEACAGVYYLLEAEGFDCWLINAREVKNVPGRAKTDGPMRSGWPKWPSVACAGPRWCSRPKSADYAISPATAAPWNKTAPASSSGWKSCSRTPRSRSRRCCRTCTASPVGRSWTP
jgi:hypothetical protein